MHIITVHTLFFSIRAVGNETHQAAVAIMQGGATSLGVELAYKPLPLADGAEVTSRGLSVTVRSESKEKCEMYWEEINRALAFIGVDVTSP